MVAGCVSHQQRYGARDWEDLGVSPAPMPVAPATPAPVPPAPMPSPPPPTVLIETNPPAEAWVSLTRWSQANHLATPIRLATAPVPAYAMRFTNGILLLRSGSQLVHWDGMELHLGFAPQVIDGQPFLHSLDLRKTIQPLFQGALGLCPGAHPVLVVDPGHGGENPGTKSVLGLRYEKEYTLDWARRLQTLLSSNGWQVFLTRSNDTDLALSNRVAFASQHRADVFLSLHFNSAAPNREEAGLETYCLTPAGMPSSLTRGFADDTGLRFPNNAFDAQNLQLALRIHRALLQVNGGHDRGIRRARFPGVLRGQQCPAILIEGGYLSNPREARLIADPAYRQKLAEAVAGALRQVNPPPISAEVQSPKSKSGA